jgi:hypothetical protein
MKYVMQWELKRPEQPRITLNVMGMLRDKTARTLQDMLVAFCTKHGNDWDLWLNAVVFAYNTRNHYLAIFKTGNGESRNPGIGESC